MEGALDPRLLLTRFVVGSGVEIGPGHSPLPLPFGAATTRYVDRWQPDAYRDLFPEVGEAVEGFVAPDIVADLDTDRLSTLPDGSQDHVIASHVLEHLAEPLGMLADIHRVLRPGGVALILLPDRRRTFDRERPPTPLEHLVDEHRRGVTVVGDEHIAEFLRSTGTWDGGEDPQARRRELEFHRRRSIHVHTWTQDEFCAVLEHTVLEMGMTWELLDAIFVEDAEDGFEFGMALARGGVDVAPGVRARRLVDTWRELAGRAAASRRTAASRDELLARATAAEARLSRLTGMPGYGVARGLYRLQRRLRGAGG